MGVFSSHFYFKFTYNSERCLCTRTILIYGMYGHMEDTDLWDAWCVFSCLTFLTVNNETVTHYLDIIYVAVEKPNLFYKAAWVYKLYPDR